MLHLHPVYLVACVSLNASNQRYAFHGLELKCYCLFRTEFCLVAWCEDHVSDFSSLCALVSNDLGLNQITYFGSSHCCRSDSAACETFLVSAVMSLTPCNLCLKYNQFKLLLVMPFVLICTPCFLYVFVQKLFCTIISVDFHLVCLDGIAVEICFSVFMFLQKI